MSAEAADASHRGIKALVKVNNKELGLFIVRLYVLQDNAGPYWADIDQLKLDVLAKLPLEPGRLRPEQLEISTDYDGLKPIRNLEQLLAFLKDVKEPSAKLRLFFSAQIAASEAASEAKSDPLPSYLNDSNAEEAPKDVKPPVADVPIQPDEQKKQIDSISKSLLQVSKERDQCLLLVKMLQSQVEKLENDLKEAKLAAQPVSPKLEVNFPEILASQLQPLLSKLRNVETLNAQLLETQRVQSDLLKDLSRAQAATASAQKTLAEGIGQQSKKLEEHIKSIQALPSKIVDELKPIVADHASGISKLIAAGSAKALEPVQTSPLTLEKPLESSSAMLESKSDIHVPAPSRQEVDDDEEEDLSVEGWRVVPIPDPASESRKLHQSLTESQMLYVEELAKLESLGHSSRSLNAMLLQINNGDVNKVLEKLEELKKHHVA